MTGDTPHNTAAISPNTGLSAPSPDAARTISSEDLMRGQRELLIEHAGEVYRLRITRNGKLILNK